MIRKFGKTARKFLLLKKDCQDDPSKITFTQNSTKNRLIKIIKILKYSWQ